jgi:D-alanine transfer protein
MAVAEWPLIPSMPKTVLPSASGRVPDGIIAAALACLIAVAGGQATKTFVRRLADRDVSLVTAGSVPFKYQTLTLQRAALASGHVLPVYGSSELFCCGAPFRPTEVFALRPTGFDVFSVGHAGMGDLLFALTFGALGPDLRNRRVVVSDSPTWFGNRDGPIREWYAANFLPEAAYAFIFEAPISLPSREMGARRMLAYPETLHDQPLLRRAAEDLADPTSIHLVRYAALVPLGRIASWGLEVRDATRTAAFLWRERHRDKVRPRPAPLDWTAMAMRGTDVARAANTTNPFGFTDATYREIQRRRKFRNALALYDSGRSNRDGTVFDRPYAWERRFLHSEEWGDLRLALHVLREVGARPLVWTLPLPGAYFDYTPISASVRGKYYDRFERTAERGGVPWLDFRAHDDDRWFVSDPGSHLSARGWVFADRAVDVFWHAGSLDDIRAALATLGRDVPAPGPPEALAHAVAARD